MNVFPMENGPNNPKNFDQFQLDISYIESVSIKKKSLAEFNLRNERVRVHSFSTKNKMHNDVMNKIVD